MDSFQAIDRNDSRYGEKMRLRIEVEFYVAEGSLHYNAGQILAVDLLVADCLRLDCSGERLLI